MNVVVPTTLQVYALLYLKVIYYSNLYKSNILERKRIKMTLCLKNGVRETKVEFLRAECFCIVLKSFNFLK